MKRIGSRCRNTWVLIQVRVNDLCDTSKARERYNVNELPFSNVVGTKLERVFLTKRTYYVCRWQSTVILFLSYKEKLVYSFNHVWLHFI